jgi:hypothetical protein
MITVMKDEDDEKSSPLLQTKLTQFTPKPWSFRRNNAQNPVVPQ